MKLFRLLTCLLLVGCPAQPSTPLSASGSQTPPPSPSPSAPAAPPSREEVLAFPIPLLKTLTPNIKMDKVRELLGEPDSEEWEDSLDYSESLGVVVQFGGLEREEDELRAVKVTLPSDDPDDDFYRDGVLGIRGPVSREALTEVLGEPSSTQYLENGLLSWKTERYGFQLQLVDDFGDWAKDGEPMYLVIRYRDPNSPIQQLMRYERGE